MGSGIASIPVDLSLLSTLDQLSLIGPCLELFVIGNRLVATLLLFFSAVSAAVKVAIAFDFSAIFWEKIFKFLIRVSVRLRKVTSSL